MSEGRREREGGVRRQLTRNTAGELVRELLHEHVIDVLLQCSQNDHWTSIASRLKGH